MPEETAEYQVYEHRGNPSTDLLSEPFSENALLTRMFIGQ